jgi:hypothetical protein
MIWDVYLLLDSYDYRTRIYTFTDTDSPPSNEPAEIPPNPYYFDWLDKIAAAARDS